MLLAIDTSTRYAGVALVNEGVVTNAMHWRSSENHTVELTPAISRLLESAHLAPKDLNGVIIALGPGGFSSLKVGMSAAKGLCTSLDAPLIGVSTLDAEAFPFKDLGMAVCPLIGMGRGEYAAALYGVQEGEWKLLQAPRLVTQEAVLALSDEPLILCGEGAQAMAASLKRPLLSGILIHTHYIPALRLWGTAYLGWIRFTKGEADDLNSTQPFYLRRPSITLPPTRQ